MVGLILICIGLMDVPYIARTDVLAQASSQFLLSVCVQYNTQKRKSSRKQGRPGITYHMTWMQGGHRGVCPTTKTCAHNKPRSEFLTRHTEDSPSREYFESCLAMEHLMMSTVHYLSVNPSPLCPSWVQFNWYHLHDKCSQAFRVFHHSSASVYTEWKSKNKTGEVWERGYKCTIYFSHSTNHCLIQDQSA